MISHWISNISLAALFLLGTEFLLCDVRTKFCALLIWNPAFQTRRINPFLIFHVYFLFFWGWGCPWGCILELRPLMDPLYTCWLIDKRIWSFGGMMIDKAKVKLINKSILVSLCEKLCREMGWNRSFEVINHMSRGTVPVLLCNGT